MSIVLTRSPLETIGMNSAGAPKRRSARLSAEGAEENEPPAKKTKVNGTETTTVSTKEQDGDSNAAAPKRRRKEEYGEVAEDFSFRKKPKSKATKQPAVRTSMAGQEAPAKSAQATSSTEPVSAPSEAPPPKIVRKGPKKYFPTTPERDAKDKSKPLRRSKRLSDENENAPNQQTSPHKPAHAKSHANHGRAGSPSPFQHTKPITVEKKRKQVDGGVEEEKITRIQLPFADTPVIKRNKEMRKSSAENGQRRSSSGMRGRRASSLIDEGRGNALPHAEVPTSEFYKHISADLTEPRRMRCLLGWCGTRALPSKPEAPKDSSPAANLEFQALQAARVIQEELSQDLITKGVLSDWFSRDESAPPQVPLLKKPNPRNVANAAKAEELERELERLKKERAEWDELIASAAPNSSPSKKDAAPDGAMSPIRSDLLDSPQRAILEQLQASTAQTSTQPSDIQQRLRDISENLEFTVDQFAHGVHTLTAARDTAERLADRALGDASSVLEEREKERRMNGKALDPMDALKGLAKVLNSQQR